MNNEIAPVIAGLAAGAGLILVLSLVSFNPSSPSNQLSEPPSPPPLWIIIERQPDNAIQSGAAGQFWLIISNEKELERFPSLRKAIEIANSEEKYGNHMFTSYPTYVVKADDTEEGDEIVNLIQSRSGLVYNIGNSSDNKIIHLQYKHQYHIILVQRSDMPSMPQ